MQRTIALVIALVSITSTAYAKPPATSFTDLRTRLDIGETVVVTTQSGKIIKGTVQGIYETILMVRSGPNDLSLAAGDVERIAIPSHATRKGMLLGLVGGFAAGAAIGYATTRCKVKDCFLDLTPAGVLLGGGLGGVTGVAIGGAIGESLPHEHVVFQRPPTLTSIEPQVQDGVGVATNWLEVQTAEQERRWLSPRFVIGLPTTPVVSAACAANLFSAPLFASSWTERQPSSLGERRLHGEASHPARGGSVRQ